ncbi:hypothetical protein I3842_14G135000 [Carya illinoinensis]|uniref:Uncharacterized protein n=1 Tax=Carya illinoinensis TaxID=32201 RepID=A0A922ADQ8_CARIL|nr:hypothetical protein I3842_14G135000 [Carya illinoinensis]
MESKPLRNSGDERLEEIFFENFWITSENLCQPRNSRTESRTNFFFLSCGCEKVSVNTTPNSFSCYDWEGIFGFKSFDANHF